MNERPHKFCKLCGHLMRVTNEKLVNHYRGQHPNEKPQFLTYGKLPSENKYTNFLEYLKDPSIDLEELKNYRKNKGGRPHKYPLELHISQASPSK